MYARTGHITAQPGKRNELAEILLHASDLVAGLPGCHAYIVMVEAGQSDTVSIFEMWADRQSHAASLQDERVRALITEAMPLLADSPSGGEFNVLGGYGTS